MKLPQLRPNIVLKTVLMSGGGDIILKFLSFLHELSRFQGLTVLMLHYVNCSLCNLLETQDSDALTDCS